jgi:hypothetical protein
MNNFINLLKTIFNNIQSILIVVLVIVILLMRECGGPSTGGNGGKKDTVVIETVKWDTLRIPEITYVPKWRTKYVHDTIPADVDTTEILKDYFAEYFYSDTLKLDSLGNIVINDTISQNKIISRNPKYNIAIPTITKETIITEYINRRELYYGFGVQGNATQLNFLGADLMYKTKKNTAYGLSVGINQNLAPVIGGRLYWKFGK